MRATKASIGIITVILLGGGLGLLAAEHAWSSPTVDRRAWEHDLNVVDRPRTDLGQLEDFTRNLCGQSEESLAIYLAAANNPQEAWSVMTINFRHVCPRDVHKLHRAYELADAATYNLRYACGITPETRPEEWLDPANYGRC